MKKHNKLTRCSFLVMMAVSLGVTAASDNKNIKSNQLASSNSSSKSVAIDNSANFQTAQNDAFSSGLTSRQVAAPTSFLENLVMGSDLIFRGKLTEISQALSIEEIPYTFVTYEVKEVISGLYLNDTITLKFVGGEYPNGNRLSATNSPNVNVGEESILMVQQRKDTGCDFVECEHGRFLLQNGKIIAANESAIVIDEKGDVDYISLAARNNGQYKASLAKSSVPNFISHLKKLSKKTLTQSNNSHITVTSVDKYLPFKAYSALTRAQQGAKVPEQGTAQNSSNPRQLTGNDHDQWEVEQLRKNDGNPVLNSTYPQAQN